MEMKMPQNVWEATKMVLRGNFIVLSDYNRKKSQHNSIIFHLWIEKWRANWIQSQRQEIIKMSKINENKNRKIGEKPQTLSMTSK